MIFNNETLPKFLANGTLANCFIPPQLVSKLAYADAHLPPAVHLRFYENDIVRLLTPHGFPTDVTIKTYAISDSPKLLIELCVQSNAHSDSKLENAVEVADAVLRLYNRLSELDKSYTLLDILQLDEPNYILLDSINTLTIVAF